MKEFLQPALYPFLISQYFGENKACYKIVDGKTFVVGKEQEALCPIGYQSLYSQMNGHNGIDMMAGHGVPLFASHSGYVVEIQTEEARGLGIGIVTDKKYMCQETSRNEYFKTRYWHMMSFAVTKGQYVRKGDYIGRADNTGYSSGDHCHFELKPVSFTGDVSFVQDVDLVNVLQNNGYFGAINPLPYMEKPYLVKVPVYYAERSENVSALQMILKYLGYFPKEQEVTGYYGDITRKSVLAFQKANMKLSWYEEYVLKGNTVGVRTLAIFNQILG